MELNGVLIVTAKTYLSAQTVMTTSEKLNLRFVNFKFSMSHLTTVCLAVEIPIKTAQFVTIITMLTQLPTFAHLAKLVTVLFVILTILILVFNVLLSMPKRKFKI